MKTLFRRLIPAPALGLAAGCCLPGPGGGASEANREETMIICDIDMQELLRGWPPIPPPAYGEHLQSAFEVIPQVANRFAAATEPATCPGERPELWYGYRYTLPARGKADGGWHFFRIEPKSAADAATCEVVHDDIRAVDNNWLYALSRMDEAVVNGRPLPDEPAVMDLMRTRHAKAQALGRTTGVSAALPSDPPLYLRREGNRMFGVQRVKSGDASAPFEHISGTFYLLWRVE